VPVRHLTSPSVRIYLPLPLISTAHLEITRKPHLEGFIKIRAKPP